MNPLEKLQQEHRDIERELLELETIMQESEINYPNLVHVLNKLFKVWKEHELKEEKIFPIFKKEKIIIPVKTMLFEHGVLKKHRDALVSAINSGNDIELKNCLKKSGVFIIGELRKHINSEDEILYTTAMNEFTKEEIKELWNLAFKEV